MSFALLDRLSRIHPAAGRRGRGLVTLLAIATPFLLMLPWGELLPVWDRLPRAILGAGLLVAASCNGLRGTATFLLLPLLAVAAGMLLARFVAPGLVYQPGLELPPPLLPVLLLALPPLLLALAAQFGLMLNPLGPLLSLPVAVTAFHTAVALVWDRPFLEHFALTLTVGILGGVVLAALYGMAIGRGLFNMFDRDSTGEQVIVDA